MSVADTVGTRPPASKSRGWLRALELTGPITGQPERVFPAVIEELAQRFGEAPALLSARECLTHGGLARRVGRAQRMADCALLREELGAARLCCARKRHLRVDGSATRCREGGERH